MPSTTNRIPIVILLGVTVFVGLLSRHIPSILGKYPGDVLYATMVYWIARLIAPASLRLRAAAVTIAICFVIEFLKLWHEPHLDAFRQTTAGKLILGSGFHTLNLVCYVMGAGVGLLIDRLNAKKGT